MTSQTTQAPVVPTTGTYTIDAAHSSVGFSVRHVGIARVRGTMGVFSGQFVIADPIEQSKADVKIDASSVDTGNKQRDEHLVSADFWEAEKNPEWTFTTTSITGDLDDMRSEEHTSELQSRGHLVCRLLLEKKKTTSKS